MSGFRATANRWLLIGLIAVGAVNPAFACSIGSGVWEQDFAQAIRSNTQVFVARLLAFRETPPPGGDGQYVNQVDYAVIEVLKGQPNSAGTLIETNPYKVTPGGVPGPSCGPWLALSSNVGHTAVVFASPSDGNRQSYLRPDPFSRLLFPGDPSSEDMLQLIRTLVEEDKSQ